MLQNLCLIKLSRDFAENPGKWETLIITYQIESHHVGENRLVIVIDASNIYDKSNSIKKVFDETPSINPKVEALRKTSKN